MTRFTEVADCRDYKGPRKKDRPVVCFVVRFAATALVAICLGLAGGMS